MLKKILGFFECPCRNCHEWIVLDFCKDTDCKYYKRYKKRGIQIEGQEQKRDGQADPAASELFGHGRSTVCSA